jgi:divalent metal cation (Fe/Co/Zn/Cd) transporter
MSQHKKHQPKHHHSDTYNEIIHTRDHAFARFPLLFTLLATFGVVATLYGFQGILEKIPLLAQDPYISLVIGILILVLTGKLYKKLG